MLILEVLTTIIQIFKDIDGYIRDFDARSKLHDLISKRKTLLAISYFLFEEHYIFSIFLILPIDVLTYSICSNRQLALYSLLCDVEYRITIIKYSVVHWKLNI